MYDQEMEIDDLIYLTCEELEAAADMYDYLVDGTFYTKQETSGFKINYI